ncbi:MFS transporter [Streptacidiphilus sp. 4-A2]|nr:MFS transporter [Streptacidiphilus sp. 4-A2]
MRTPGRISWGAALLLSAWLVALLLAVSEGPTWGWGSGRILGLFAAAVVCAALWILVELRSANPLIDMRMMRIPAVWTTNLVALLFGVVMYTTMTFLPQLVQTPEKLAGYGFDASITQSGLYMLPMTIGMFIFGVLSGPLSVRLGSKLVLVAGSLLTIVPFVLLGLADDKSWEIYVASSVMGIGMGLAFSSMSSIVVEAVSPSQTGVASGMNANIRTIGGAIGSGVAASILANGVTIAHPLPKASGYTTTFWMMAGAAVLAAVAAMIIPIAPQGRRGDRSGPRTPQDAAPRVRKRTSYDRPPGAVRALRQHQGPAPRCRGEPQTGAPGRLGGLRRAGPGRRGRGDRPAGRVGMGTLYRRFPTKEALVQALNDALLEELLASARRTVAEASGDGLEEYLWYTGRLMSAHHGCLSRLWQRNLPTSDPRREELWTMLRQLLERARQAGAVRADLMLTDVYLTVLSLRGLIEETAAVAPEIWRRFLEVQLAGFRPAGQQPAERELRYRPEDDSLVVRGIDRGAAPAAKS